MKPEIKKMRMDYLQASKDSPLVRASGSSLPLFGRSKKRCRAELTMFRKFRFMNNSNILIFRIYWHKYNKKNIECQAICLRI